MKKINKLLFVVVLLGAVLLLTSCTKKETKDKTPQMLTVNETSGELFADFTSTIEADKVDNIDAYFVLFNGSLEKLGSLGKADSVSYVFPNEVIKTSAEVVKDTNDEFYVGNAYKRIFAYTEIEKAFNNSKKDQGVVKFELNYTQYNSKLSEESKAIVGNILGIAQETVSIADDKNKTISTGLVLTTSYVFESKGINFYEVNVDGTTTKVNNDNIRFDDNGFFDEDNLVVDRAYRNYEKATINYTVVYGANNTQEFVTEIWLAETLAPLNVKTASFWNWIFLQMPIAYLMAFIGSITGKSFAIAILVTTILVRTLAWPIYAKTNDMSLKMAVAQPEIDRLNRKYANRKDPESQQKMQMEMAALYKKYNINVFGCLLPVLQMPIFFAMYQVVQRIVIPGGQFSTSVSNSSFLGSDLTTTGIIAKVIYTLLVGVSMFVLQKISQVKPSYAKKTVPAQAKPGQPNQENTMKMVSYMMILMMVFTAFFTPGTSLSFYWIIGNIYSIIQTLINRQISEKKHAKLEEEKLYGRSREIIDAEFKKKGDK